MSHPLIDRSEDLRRLRDDGYNLSIVGANLVVRDIPYVNERREVRHDGVLISTLNLSGEIVNTPRDDHTMRFAGDYPCSHDGQRIDAINAGSEVVRYSETLSAQHRFSSKPRLGYYESYCEKVRTYAAILSGPACVIDKGATAQTRRVVEPEEGDDSPFQYLDTASGRAEISIITQKLAAERVAIVGVGGTGSYVLDFLAKTPIKEIHLFDGDTFASHNAFRAPGAASIDDLHKQQHKVDYLVGIYSKMHKRIVPHGAVDASNVELLRWMSTTFLCIDAGSGKKFIVDKLEEFGAAFIDTGMGLYAKDEKLGGILRVTTSEPANRAVARARMSFAATDEPNEYDKNIQVAELNALNGALAVIRWKKLRGFYFDLKHERFSTYTIGGNLLLNEDLHEQG